MMKLMGFGGFDTTKNKHVPGTDASAANVRKPLKYRQYMNRRGGFNRYGYYIWRCWLYGLDCLWIFFISRPLDKV